MSKDKLAEALPPLPHTDYALWREARPYESDYLSSEPGYSADDMRAYALAAHEAGAKPAPAPTVKDSLTPAPLPLREQLDARTPWDELEAILTQNEKDAERYRWLRSENNDSAAAVLRDYGIDDPAELDAFIDAAIAASNKGGGNGNP